MVKINILHLKYAVEVANEGSINKAAEKLYMGQPNLSRAIKELESSLGITIFERSSKGMVITPDGEEFLNHAKKILNQIEEVEKLYKSNGISKQHFSISVPRASYIAKAFSNFSSNIDNSKPIEFFYKETNSMRTIRNVLSSEYKLGIIRYSKAYDGHFKQTFKDDGLFSELVAEFKYVLIMSENHPLAKAECIHFEDLKPFTEISHADPFVPSLPFSEVKKEEIPDNMDKRIYVFERASQFELLSENTQAFMWVSPVPEDMLSKYNLVQRVCEDNKKIYKDVLIYKNNYVLSNLDKDFITELCCVKRKYFK